MKKLINENKPKELAAMQSQLSNVNGVVDVYKQSEELRILQEKYKYTDNYRLELETNLKIKEIESETAIRLKELDIELQHKKNIQMAMENGYDLDNISISKTKTSPRKKEIIRL